MKTVSTKVSQKKLRALAERALRVTGRHTSHVGVKVAAVSLEPAAAAYAKAYDDAARVKTNQNAELADRRESMVELDKLLRSSLAILGVIAPTLNTSDLTASVETPDQLMINARGVLEVLMRASDRLPADQTLTAELTAAVEKAEAQWAAAQTSRAALQDCQANLRKLAIAFNRELIALRRILRATVGTHNLDYQTLRASRVKSVEIENEEDTVVEEEVFETPAHPAGVSNGSAKANTPAPAFASGTMV